MKASNGNGKGSKPRHCPDWRKLGQHWDEIDWRTQEQKDEDFATRANELRNLYQNEPWYQSLGFCTTNHKFFLYTKGKLPKTVDLSNVGYPIEAFDVRSSQQ